MSEETERRVVHLVLIDGRQPDAGAAADDLIRGLRPLLADLTRRRHLLNATFGHPLEVDRGDVELEAFDSFSHVVHLEFATRGYLEAYYRAPLHKQLRFEFYRRLPDLAVLWSEFDAAPVERRDEVFVRIDRRATQLYLRRVDYMIV